MNPSSPPAVHDHAATVSMNRDLGAGHFLLSLEADSVAASAAPGHFVMLRFPGSIDPLLPRPMSVSNTLPAEAGRPGCIEILHKVVGKGTARLAALRPGEGIQVLGPLGRPFHVPPAPSPGSQACMVAGGIGIAIFPLLVPELERQGYQPVLLFGARSSRDLVQKDWFARNCVAVHVATEDGSEGVKGLVTAPLGSALRSSAPPALVYACGPQAMLKAVAGLVNAAGVPAQLSLESYMGCGIGACLGCVVKVRREADFVYQRICVDGPTFPATEVLWE